MEKPESSKDENETEQLLRLFMQKLMGKALDYARISGMSDRSLEQYKKNLKDDSYALFEHFKKLLSEVKPAN